MKNFFEADEGYRTWTGFLVKAVYQDKSHGVVTITRFRRLHIVHKDTQIVYFCLTRAEEWAGLQEPKSLTLKERLVPPYRRPDLSRAFEYGFEYLDVIPTANGSRFLSLKRPYGFLHQVHSMSREILNSFMTPVTILSGCKELSDYLDELLPLLGVPSCDVQGVKRDILVKIGGNFKHI
jgi:hypothetical protein